MQKPPPAVFIGGNLGETNEELLHRLFWGRGKKTVQLLQVAVLLSSFWTGSGLPGV